MNTSGAKKKGICKKYQPGKIHATKNIHEKRLLAKSLIGPGNPFCGERRKC